MFKPSINKIYSKLGYIQDQEGILTRFLREGSAWETHLELTKKWIVDSCKPEYKSIAIMGSGWLLDIPIDFLLTQFSTIYLIDVIHPKQITHKYRKQTQIVFIEADVTGGMIEGVYNLIFRKKIPSISEFINQKFPLYKLPNVDICVSLNILNQLDILLIDAISEHITIDDIQKKTIREKIQSNHTKMLSAMNYCLISDWIQVNTDIETQNETTKDLVIVSPPQHTHSETWKWQFDTKGMYEEKQKVHFIVKAFRN